MAHSCPALHYTVWPKFQTIDIYHLNEENPYEKTVSFVPGETLTTELFPGLEINVAQVFKE